MNGCLAVACDGAQSWCSHTIYKNNHLRMESVLSKSGAGCRKWYGDDVAIILMLTTSVCAADFRSLLANSRAAKWVLNANAQLQLNYIHTKFENATNDAYHPVVNFLKVFSKEVRAVGW